MLLQPVRIFVVVNEDWPRYFFAVSLGLLLQPTGRASFFWFRKVRGYPTWKTIGRFPDMTIENARAAAQKYNTDLANWRLANYEGPSPFERQGTPTLQSVLDDYIERHLKANAKNPDKAVKHARWQFDHYLSDWKMRKLSEIRREDVRNIHAEIGSRKAKAGSGLLPRPTPTQHITMRRFGTMRTLTAWLFHCDSHLPRCLQRTRTKSHGVSPASLTASARG